MSENEDPKKIVNLSAEQLKKIKPKHLGSLIDPVAEEFGLPPEAFAPPQDLKELSLSEAYEYAREVTDKYSNNDTFMREYIEQLYHDHPQAEQRAAEGVERDLNEDRAIVDKFTTEEMRSVLSYLKADSRYYPLAFMFVTAEAFLNRFPRKPGD